MARKYPLDRRNIFFLALFCMTYISAFARPDRLLNLRALTGPDVDERFGIHQRGMAARNTAGWTIRAGCCDNCTCHCSATVYAVAPGPRLLADDASAKMHLPYKPTRTPPGFRDLGIAAVLRCHAQPRHSGAGTIVPELYS